MGNEKKSWSWIPGYLSTQIEVHLCKKKFVDGWTWNVYHKLVETNGPKTRPSPRKMSNTMRSFSYIYTSFIILKYHTCCLELWSSCNQQSSQWCPLIWELVAKSKDNDIEYHDLIVYDDFHWHFHEIFQTPLYSSIICNEMSKFSMIIYSWRIFPFNCDSDGLCFWSTRENGFYMSHVDFDGNNIIVMILKKKRRKSVMKEGRYFVSWYSFLIFCILWVTILKLKIKFNKFLIGKKFLLFIFLKKK